MVCCGCSTLFGGVCASPSTHLAYTSLHTTLLCIPPVGCLSTDSPTHRVDRFQFLECRGKRVDAFMACAATQMEQGKGKLYVNEPKVCVEEGIMCLSVCAGNMCVHTPHTVAAFCGRHILHGTAQCNVVYV